MATSLELLDDVWNACLNEVLKEIDARIRTRTGRRLARGRHHARRVVKRITDGLPDRHAAVLALNSLAALAIRMPTRENAPAALVRETA